MAALRLTKNGKTLKAYVAETGLSRSGVRLQLLRQGAHPVGKVKSGKRGYPAILWGR